MKKIKEKTIATTQFLRIGVWRFRLSDLPSSKALLIKQLRIFILAIRGFIEHKCTLRASALTFFSLLSIVPFVATLFGIAKGFGLQKLIEDQLLQKFSEHEKVMFQVIDFSKALLENTKGGIIAGIGIILLLWSVIKLLGNIENSLNDIWGIKAPRTIVRKLSDYLAILLIAPLILAVSSGLTVFIKVQVAALTEQIVLLGFIAPIIALLIKILPYIMNWLLFTLIYIVIPNSKVNFSAGLFAAVIAGTIYQIIQWLFITFQVGAASYNAIYGSFAALPLFLIWLQISWFIVLFGAEISFAFQNVASFEFETDARDVSYHHKRLLSLLIAHIIVKNFESGKKALTAPQIAENLALPLRLVRKIIQKFVDSELFSKVSTEEYKEPAYQPASDIRHFTIKYVIDALDKQGSQKIVTTHSKEFKDISDVLTKMSDSLENSPLNKLIKDI